MGRQIKGMKRLLVVLSITSMGLASADETETRTMANQQRVDQSRYLEAAAAAQRGDYVVAYCFWRPLAEKGDAEAQYALGWMYHNGYGLVTDDRAAKGWWEKAVAQGHTDAMFSLGTLYSVGSEAVARDHAAAMRLWVQAAGAGHENARFALRELALRNLPELKSVTESLRVQYPQLFAPAPRKNIKTRLGKQSRVNGDRVDESDAQGALGFNVRNEELIAVAVGYRPEYGWAAAQLFKEGGQLIASIQK
jgi:TPR repeat protein